MDVEEIFTLCSSLVINISLLVLIATILTKISFVKQVLVEDDRRLKILDQLILGLIFGAFCIFSTCTGVKVAGAIQNTRVLGAMAGGMLGGPVVGITAGLIGAVHRYFYDAGGLTSLSCTISTLFEGVLGSVVWCVCKKRKLDQNPISLFLITVLAEAAQMGFILCIAKPFADALALVKVIAFPMIVFNSLGMVLFFSVFKEVFAKQDLLAANKIRLALNIADQCIPYVQKNQLETDDYDKISEIIQKFSGCKAVVILNSNGTEALNHTKLSVPPLLIRNMDKEENYCEQKDRSDPNYKLIGRYLAIGAKMTFGKETWSYLVLFFHLHVDSIASQVNFVKGLAKFFSTNYELSQVEHQKKLREQAEFKALQSQINPHFLFNSLNTIACFCREKPERARELLIALSIYFRHTLKSSSDYMISLEEELEQVKAYLMLEEARFEDKLEIKIDVTIPENVQIKVPTLILQPIVENAVKHGAKKREHGIVAVSGKQCEDRFSLEVRDNGPGIPDTVLRKFYEGKMDGCYGLLNVDARLRSIYGEPYALQIKTDEGGTVITMNIPDEMIERGETKDEDINC